MTKRVQHANFRDNPLIKLQNNTWTTVKRWKTRRRTLVCLWVELFCYVSLSVLVSDFRGKIRYMICMSWLEIEFIFLMCCTLSDSLDRFDFLCNTHAKWALKLNATDGKDDCDAAAVAGCDGGKSEWGSRPHPPDFGHSWCRCVRSRVQRRSSLWGRRKLRIKLCSAMSRRRWLCGFHLYVIDVTYFWQMSRSQVTDVVKLF